MMTANDCGPAAVSAVLDIDLGAVKRAWGWSDYAKLSDLNDHPFKHFEVVGRLGHRFRLRTCGDILNGTATPEKTIVLIHGRGLLNAIVDQHWVIYLGRTTAGTLLFAWGNGENKVLSDDDLIGYYSRGWPACAYEIDPAEGGQTGLSWWKRLYCRFTGVIA